MKAKLSGQYDSHTFIKFNCNALLAHQNMEIHSTICLFLAENRISVNINCTWSLQNESASPCMHLLPVHSLNPPPPIIFRIFLTLLGTLSTHLYFYTVLTQCSEYPVKLPSQQYKWPTLLFSSLPPKESSVSSSEKKSTIVFLHPTNSYKLYSPSQYSLLVSFLHIFVVSITFRWIRRIKWSQSFSQIATLLTIAKL